ncbi:cytochrome P450 [Apodospora peruviana]|uniref:Cytochrome P450 n=1 Tax=Apodospora peruviana TaxID=516989 RepID=A0AAE0M4G9_9PEZI|nr:cytochrome P450 [Apodospora peruviana]
MDSSLERIDAYLVTALRGLSGINLTSLAEALAIATGVTVFVWHVVSWALSPLRRYPGPFLAGWTNLWRFVLMLKGEEYHLTVKKLHEKYGPVVRTGPNLLDIDYPELAKVIYGTDGKWSKTEMYQNNSTIIDGKITYHLFSETNQVIHARKKRPVVKYYSMSSVLALEPKIDGVINEFCKQLEQRFINGPAGPKDCDLGEWLAFCTWDFLSTATFSRSFGYLDKGCDFDGSIAIADTSLDYFKAISQMPFLDYWLDKNPIVRIGPANLTNVTRIAFESLMARIQGKDANYDPKTHDYLQYFIESKKKNPELVDDGTIMEYLLVNLIAGADTTAVTIRSIIYLCLKRPTIYRKLEEEILAAGLDPERPAPYNVARQLPYLEAVVREALRFHPVVAVTMERYVPESGVRLPDGSFVPGGVAIGMNPYVVGRNKDVFGQDAQEFRPERWLQAPGEDQETYRLRRQSMNAADLTFGGGSRICIGKTLALCEVYKIAATLIQRYEIELADPTKEWKVEGSWFTRQRGIITKLRLREHNLF